MKETGAGGNTNFRKISNTAGGYANFQLKEYDMKAKGAGGYAFFQKTRHKATTLESANTISDTTTPAPASLCREKIPHREQTKRRSAEQIHFISRL